LGESSIKNILTQGGETGLLPTISSMLVSLIS
jgi:hypothetical protein